MSDADLLERLDRRLALEGPAAAAVPPGYRLDAKGRFAPAKLVGAAEQLEDDVVRRLTARGLDLADRVARFRAGAFADVAAFLEVLDALRVVGSRVYLRIYLRGDAEARWRPVPISLAADWTDTDELDEAAS